MGARHVVIGLPDDTHGAVARARQSETQALKLERTIIDYLLHVQLEVS
jgi:hypothetical protein